MSLNDVSARFKSQQSEPSSQKSVSSLSDTAAAESFRIRARMVGVLIRDARINAGRTLEECARVLQTPSQQIEHWEWGEIAPSLPELELLANYLGVPVSQFWSTHTLQSDHPNHANSQDEYLALRHHMIGALLRHAREQAGLSIEDIAHHANIDADNIKRYELGEIPLPMHELTVLANAVNKNLDYFLESSSHIGELLALREKWKHFAELPEEIQEFAANPLNIGFIEIAALLSTMPTDRLRRIGESVLNITM